MPKALPFRGGDGIESVVSKMRSVGLTRSELFRQFRLKTSYPNLCGKLSGRCSYSNEELQEMKRIIKNAEKIENYKKRFS